MLLPLLVIPQVAAASGWNDYSLTIAPGYEIARCNSFDIGLVDANSSIIYIPDPGGKSGPINGYVATSSHIYLRTTGQKPRNKFAGDTYIFADPSVEFFLVVDRSNNNLRGPLTAAEFSTDADAMALGPPNWIAPKNPNPEQAYAGQLMFLGITAMIFGVPLLLVSLVVFGLYRLFRSPRIDASPSA